MDEVDRERERRAFESWVLAPSLGLYDPRGYGGNHLQIDKDEHGRYTWPEIQKLWLAWQAARHARR